MWGRGAIDTSVFKSYAMDQAMLELLCSGKGSAVVNGSMTGMPRIGGSAERLGEHELWRAFFSPRTA
jgi:hypothetical protein